MKNLASSTWIKSQRQASNLKRILTKSNFSKAEENGVTKCSRPRCKTCDLIEETKEIQFKRYNEIFQIRSNMDCTSRNVIYCIKCVGCEKDYIGQTGDQLRNRMTIHRQQINWPELRQIGLSEHLDVCAHNKEPKFRVIPFYKVGNDSEDTRKVMGKHFINKFKPELNEIPLRNQKQ